MTRPTSRFSRFTGRMRLLAAAIPAAAALAGCAGPEATAVGAAVSVVSLNVTKKTVTDHIASAVTGRDCSIITLNETGEYCPEQVVVDRSNLYCYRTLGGVDCHTLPDPYKNSQTSLASPPPVRKTISQKSMFD